jgi:hypothetical protein
VAAHHSCEGLVPWPEHEFEEWLVCQVVRGRFLLSSQNICPTRVKATIRATLYARTEGSMIWPVSYLVSTVVLASTYDNSDPRAPEVPTGLSLDYTKPRRDLSYDERVGVRLSQTQT